MAYFGKFKKVERGGKKFWVDKEGTCYDLVGDTIQWILVILAIAGVVWGMTMVGKRALIDYPEWKKAEITKGLK